ncbi:hypothetical protein FRC04_001961 [Tulasnella sp. 424]|nr:hypothetical protein FRC04_001961 [Tulasnella sp. 424]
MVPDKPDNVVVDYHWVNACVDAQTLLGPPSWGGHYLSPLTLDHFFNASPPTTSQPSPSLSQAPTLVSPLYTPQFLPSSDAPPSRKPSLPTIPPQILQKFQPSGPGTSPTGYFSSQSATTPFGEDHLSRQLSAATEESTSTKRDPAPTPPPQSQKKQMGGGNSSKYYYTDAENDYLEKYSAWADRQGIPSTSVPDQIAELVDAVAYISKHPISLLNGLTGNKGWAYVPQKSRRAPNLPHSLSLSKYDRVKLGRRPSSDQSGNNSADGRRRTRNNSTGVRPTLLPERLMMWPPAEAPPEAPSPGPPTDLEVGHPFTPEDKVYVVEFTRWAGRRVPDIDLQLLSSALAQFAPHHSPAKWYGHMYKYSNQYAKRVPNQLAHLFLDEISDEEEDEEPDEEPDDKKYFSSATDGSENPGTLAGPSSKTAAPPNKQKTPLRGPWGRLVAYTEEELDGMAILMVQNPDRKFYTLFSEFVASRAAAGIHPQRKPNSYAQYARTHEEWLRKRGRALLDSSSAQSRPKRADTKVESDEEAQLNGEPWNSDDDDDEGDHDQTSTPPSPNEVKKRGKRGPLVPYTEEELDAIAKVVTENADKPLAALFSGFAKSRAALGLHPRRKAHTYTEYYRRHMETLNKRGCLLLGKEYQPPESDPELPSRSPSPPPAKKLPTPAANSVDAMSIDDARLGQPYTDEDYTALTEFVARNPGLLRNSEEGKHVKKKPLWQKFDQEYPGRTPKAWREYFRKRADQIEQDALALIEEKQKAPVAGSSRDAQAPEIAGPVTKPTQAGSALEIQSSSSSEIVDRKGPDDTVLSRAEPAPSTSGHSPSGTKRTLPEDTTAESSMPAMKKLKE